MSVRASEPAVAGWVRGLLAFDGLVRAAMELESDARDLALAALVPTREGRARVSDALYAANATYTPGGAAFERGLFAWEERVLASPPFPARGRLLLGGAGGGRELAALLARGYDVVAFEPCARLAEAAARVGGGRALVLRGSYGDLVRACVTGEGPLGAAVLRAPFDGVVLGWGSFSHVHAVEDRTALLRALARLAPRAPVLVSFVTHDGPGPLSRRLRARETEREGAPLAFARHGGFVRPMTERSLAGVARDAAYEIASYEDAPYGHAVLVAAGAARALPLDVPAAHQGVAARGGLSPAVRAILAVDDALQRAHALEAAVRDELLLAGVDPRARASVTELAYARNADYLRGGSVFERGLFAWERRLMDAPAFPRSGRILLGAAGGGRELRAFRALGYDVVAFEPCARLAASAADVAAEAGGVFVRASYRDLVRASEGKGSPLAEAMRGRRFDAVVLGWGSFAHLSGAEQEATLAALRTAAGSAVVALTFFEPDAPPGVASRLGRVRASVRRACAPVVECAGRRQATGETAFHPAVGFVTRQSRDAVRELAKRHDYEVAFLECATQPGALLKPRSSLTCSAGLVA